MKILITGTSSGLGAFLCTKFNGTHFDRSKNIKAYQSEQFDLIIHCAVDARKQIQHLEIEDYFHNNLDLTKKILTIPHKHFIYISSVDVYPKNLEGYSETTAINANDIQGLYGLMKYYSEAVVMRQSPCPMILRPTAILGPNMRSNTLIKLLQGQEKHIGLSGNSEFNYILQEDIAAIIKEASETWYFGILNVCSTRNITLKEVSLHYNKAINFGEFTYTTPNIDGQRLKLLNSYTPRTSLETVQLFWEKYADLFN